jgi:hypothetical protein
MSPLGDPRRPDLNIDIAGAVEMITAKIDAGRDLREGLASILGLPYGVTNDQIFTAVRILKSSHARLRRDDIARIEELEREFPRLDAEHARLVKHLRAKGVLE